MFFGLRHLANRTLKHLHGAAAATWAAAWEVPCSELPELSHTGVAEATHTPSALQALCVWVEDASGEGLQTVRAPGTSEMYCSCSLVAVTERR